MIRVRGFTLIEAMITVAIVAILAAIAYPSYLAYVVRAHRGDAQQAMEQMATQSERFFTARNSYVSSAALTTFLTTDIAAAESSGRYTYAVVVSGGGLSFRVTGTPVPTASNHADGTLILGSDGTRTRGGNPW